ncbi:MAG: hypothetical protein JXP73_11760 [Deltaproteobacteria bacterium]|nr:hypothetical protein [Deltaproteobacteria bacterium]
MLVYLDQSALSRLAEGRFPDLLETLRRGIHSGALLCPESFEHRDETVLADKSRFDAITELSDELSMGVGLLDREDVWRNEVHVAVASFLGEEPPMEIWKEAFEKDPHLPLDHLFPVSPGLRVTFPPEKVDWREEEARKRKEPFADLLNEHWQRSTGASFEEQTEVEFQGSLGLLLMPLVNPSRFLAWLKESRALMEEEIRAGHIESDYNRYVHRHELGEFSDFLLCTYPTLRNRLGEFLASRQLRCTPSLRYPALLFAALFCTLCRKVRESDVFDIQHLTQGLSRCDIVTADGAWVQWCRERNLVPGSVRLFSSRELDQLTAHLHSVLN